MYYHYKRNPDDKVVEFRLLGKETAAPTLLEVTAFLYDFNLAYEIGRLATDPIYDDVNLSRFSFFRHGRPLAEEDRLQVGKLRQESPLELVAAVTAFGGIVGSVWVVVQIVEKIANFRLNREKLELEIQKLRSERHDAQRPTVIVEEQVAFDILKKRSALPILDRVERRLSVSTIKIEHFEICVTEKSRPRDVGQKGA
jgi:hypothetical protein